MKNTHLIRFDWAKKFVKIFCILKTIDQKPEDPKHWEM